MRGKRLLRGFAVAAALAAGGLGLFTVAGAQEEEERSRFVRFVENTISTPDRQIRLGRIDGALSSDVRISSITISDAQGVWLTIENAHLIWSRLELLRGRLDIDLLEAERIAVARAPVAAEGIVPESPETPAPFALPELPVEVDIDELTVPRVEIGAGIVGDQPANLGIAGSASLQDGTLDADLAIERLDDQGGSLTLQANYVNESQQLDLNLTLSEPEDGVVANLLNLQGRPAITFVIDGSGPVRDFAADISLTANEQQVLAGRSTIARVEDGLRFVADIGGSLQQLVPPVYAEFFGADSRLIVEAVRRDDGTIGVSRAELGSGVFALNASAEIAADGFPTALSLDARLAAEGAEPVVLPMSGGSAVVAAASLTASLGGQAGEAWAAEFDLTGLETGTASADSVTISAGGEAQNLADPGNRRLTFEVTGAATGLTSVDQATADALGERIDIVARGEWAAGQPVTVETARIDGETARVSFEGRIGDAANGAYALAAENISVFSGLAGRDLAGAAELEANGSIGLGDGTFDLALDGTTRNLEFGIEALNGLLAGTTTLEGRAARGEQGIRFDSLVLDNPQMRAELDGSFAEVVDLVVDARLADVGDLTDRASGAIVARATLGGTVDLPEIDATVRGEALTLMERAFTNAVVSFDGTVAGSAVNGDLALTGALDGVPVELGTRIRTLADGGRAIENLVARAGETNASGNLILRADGLYEADLAVDSPDVSLVAPLFLADASGAVSADIALSVVEGGQSAAVTATARDFRYGTISLGAADIDLTGEDLLSAPLLAGALSAERLAFGENVVDALSATFDREGDTTAFVIDADLAQGDLSATGSLAQAGERFDVTLSTLALDGAVDAALSAPATVSIEAGTVSIPRAELAVGGGGIAVSGQVGEVLDLAAEIDALPLSVANAFAPDLAVDGTLSGSLDAGGTTAAPVVDFAVSGSGITAAPLREAGVDALDIEAEGRFADGTVTLDASTDIGGGAVTASGTVGETLDLDVNVDGLPLSLANTYLPDLGLQGTLSGTVDATGSLAEPRATFDVDATGVSLAALRAGGVAAFGVQAQGQLVGRTVTLTANSDIGGGIAVSGTVGETLDLDAEIDAFPLSIANAFAPDLGLAGTLSGTVGATGSLAAPQVTFDAGAQGVNATALRGLGIGPLAATAQGTYAGDAVSLDAAISGSGLDFTVSGDVPVSGDGLAVSVAGTAPLSLADNALAARGARVSGALVVDVDIAGSFSDPRISGSVTTSGAGFIDPETGIQLRNIALSAALSGDAVTIQNLSANSGDGTINVAGSVGFAPGSGFPADLTIALRNARYEDGTLISATVGGDLTVTGPLTGQPVIGGTVLIDRAEITVPENLPAGSVVLDVEHVSPPLPVARTLALAQLDAAGADDGGEPSGVVLDLTVQAPRQIFVRGRGLDAELGGELTLTGPVSSIQPVGSFELIRGRLDILGQRITFDRGSVTLFGDLDPYLDFVATTQGDNIAVTATVTGRASDPQVGFSSVPELPQDEVLAQLLFGRGIDELSPLQLVQLASAVSGFGGGPGLLDQIRGSTGLDDLDLVVDQEGNAAVQAGRYISENVYLGIRTGATPETSGVTLDLDITEQLKARGEVGGDGRSSLGLFYEKEY